MANYIMEDINDLQQVIKDARDLTRPMKQFENVVAKLENVVAKLEQEKEAEMLKFVYGGLLPELTELETVYQQVAVALQRKFWEVDDGLSDKESGCISFRPDSMVHISADTVSNTGDYILVRALRELVEKKTQKDIAWAPLNVRKNFGDEQVAYCNRSNGVIIGGGGLFLTDTNPNEISGWQWPCSIEDMRKIEVPIYVLGVGYNRFRGQKEFNSCFRDNLNALVEKSSFFGLRNYGSIRAVREYLREDLWEKVQYHPCATTVLSKLYKLPKRQAKEPVIAINCAFDRSQMRYGNKKDEVMSAIAKVAKCLSADYRIKCYIHCRFDEEICPYLEKYEVPYEKVIMTREMSEEEYLRYFTEPELVLAIRGHAQMIPFGCKTPTVSMISHDKLKWFLEDIGHPEWGVEVLDENFEDELLDISKNMLNNRETICGEIEEAQERLWEILNKNIEHIRFGETGGEK